MKLLCHSPSLYNTGTPRTDLNKRIKSWTAFQSPCMPVETNTGPGMRTTLRKGNFCCFVGITVSSVRDPWPRGLGSKDLGIRAARAASWHSGGLLPPSGGPQSQAPRALKQVGGQQRLGLWRSVVFSGSHPGALSRSPETDVPLQSDT